MIVWSMIYIFFLCASVYFDVGSWWFISTSCFLLGLWFDKCNKVIVMLQNNKLLSYTCFSVFIIFYFLTKGGCLTEQSYFSVPTTYWITLLDMILAPLFVLLCLCLSFLIKSTNKLLILGGKISYEYYLYHMCWLMILRTMHLNQVTVLASVIVLTIISSVVMHVLNITISNFLTICRNKISYCVVKF